MSSGGLLDLVAHGVHDIFLIGNPQITFFKQVYKRHTNFSIESINIPLLGDPNFGKKFSCTIPAKGDLIHSLFLEIDLPEITDRITDPSGGTNNSYSDGKGTISWVNNIGHAIINHIDLKIGGQLIDRHYGEWMEIWSQLSTSPGKSHGLDHMLARSDHVGIDGPQPVIITGPRTLIIPLQFWFCTNIGLALPLIALQYHNIDLDFYLNPLQSCYTFGPNHYYYATGTNGASTIILRKPTNNTATPTTFNGRILHDTSGAQYYIHPTTAIITNFATYTMPLTSTLSRAYVDELIRIGYNGAIANESLQLVDVRLYGDFIYLDTTERNEFAKKRHRYLIEQVQARDVETISAGVGTINFPVKFNLPVKELVWTLQRADVALTNDWFNYSNTVNPALVRGNILANANIYFNGTPRFSPRGGDYFRLTVPYQKHTNVPNDFYYMYSFAYRPEEYQPSGSTNFSKLNNVYIALNLAPALPNLGFRVFGHNYNILRIENGMGGVVFNN
jgi:hypothetical protein